MGDRANIRIEESEGGVLHFYSHWYGTELPQTLASALARGRDRWDDEQYLSRIIFCEMVKDDILSETGFGISTYRGDHEYPDLVVNMKEKTVTDREGKTFSFDDYARLAVPSG